MNEWIALDAPLPLPLRRQNVRVEARQELYFEDGISQPSSTALNFVSCVAHRLRVGRLELYRFGHDLPDLSLVTMTDVADNVAFPLDSVHPAVCAALCRTLREAGICYSIMPRA